MLWEPEPIGTLATLIPGDEGPSKMTLDPWNCGTWQISSDSKDPGIVKHSDGLDPGGQGLM